MKSNTVIIVCVIAAIGLIVYLSLSPGTSEKDYAASIANERLAKDKFMKESTESPFVDKTSFTKLEYFEPSRKYLVKADLVAIKSPGVRLLPTSSGEENNYLEYGWAEFELDGVLNKLLILENMAMGPARGTLFLAFADATSAIETYGAGRYLDIRKVPGASSIELDFNKAYNPYCAYNDNFSCPLPPKENILQVAILAGEKNYPSPKP